MDPMAGMLLMQGVRAYQAAQLDKAAALFEATLKLAPDNFDALHFAGLVASDQGRQDKAVSLIQQALAINPQVAAAYVNLASCQRRLKAYDAALANLDIALRLAPRSAEAFNTRGNVLRTLGQLEAALESLDQAIALAPDFVEAHDNRGNVLRDMGLLDEAIASYETSQKIAPGYASARWNESLCRLLKADFEHGWPLYEAGWEIGLRTPWLKFSEPLWTGAEPLQGQTILLHAEQGLGDTLHFCRYASVLARQGAHVILEVQPALRDLLSGQEGIHVIAQGTPRPSFDFHSPLLSLPGACKTTLKTIPAPATLSVPEGKISRWTDILGPVSRPCRIGLAWSGSQTLENDRNRSIALDQFESVFQLPAEFISLQVDIRASDSDCFTQAPIRDFSAHLHDFSDTAALVSQLDLVVSVDTAVAHLAATLGRPTWLLLSTPPDWRWLMERTDSPWYPTMRLFRRPIQHGSWKNLIKEQITPALAALADQGY